MLYKSFKGLKLTFPCIINIVSIECFNPEVIKSIRVDNEKSFELIHDFLLDELDENYLYVSIEPVMNQKYINNIDYFLTNINIDNSEDIEYFVNSSQLFKFQELYKHVKNKYKLNNRFIVCGFGQMMNNIILRNPLTVTHCIVFFNYLNNDNVKAVIIDINGKIVKTYKNPDFDYLIFNWCYG
jgi:hypothetical protein